MRIEAVAERLGKSKRTILRWVDTRRHGIPQPTIRNAAMVAWPDAMMTRWLRRYRNGKGAPRGGSKHRHPSARR